MQIYIYISLYPTYTGTLAHTETQNALMLRDKWNVKLKSLGNTGSNQKDLMTYKIPTSLLLHTFSAKKETK